MEWGRGSRAGLSLRGHLQDKVSSILFLSRSLPVFLPCRSAGQSKVLMDQTVRGMGQDPLMLLPARNMVPFAVGDSTKEARGEQGLYYRVPGLQSVLEGAYYGKGSGDGADPGDGASPGEHVEGANVAPFPSSAIPISPFGPIAARPIMKERSLDLNTYLLFALAGAVGCAGTHSLVVPIGEGLARLLRASPASPSPSSARD